MCSGHLLVHGREQQCVQNTCNFMYLSSKQYDCFLHALQVVFQLPMTLILHWARPHIAPTPVEKHVLALQALEVRMDVGRLKFVCGVLRWVWLVMCGRHHNVLNIAA